MATLGFVLLGMGASVSSLAAEQVAYGGNSIELPGLIQAEYFDEGGEGVAYHDADAGNNGAGPRVSDVDVDHTRQLTSGEGDVYVGWTRAGEWLEYTVVSRAAGPHWVEVRVASQGQGGTFHIEFDGVRTSTYQVPDTGGWHEWTVLTSSFGFQPNVQHVMRVVMDSAGPSGSVANIDWIRIVPKLARFPGKVEAERYTFASDSDAGNHGGHYQFDGNVDIDIDQSLDGAAFDNPTSEDFYVGWTRAGEFLDYFAYVEESGNYEIQARVASDGPGGRFHIEFGGVDKTGPLMIPNTGGWQRWKVLRKQVYLTAGSYTMRVALDSEGTTGSVGNLDWVRVVSLDHVGQPYGGAPMPVPGRITIEKFDQGGEGVSYHDSDVGNNGAFGRSDDVDIDVRDNSGSYLAWTEAGEWVNYTVDVQTVGYYDVMVFFASQGEGGTFHLEVDGIDKTGPIVAYGTGGWLDWRPSIRHRIFLNQGRQVMRLAMDSNGPSGSVANISGITFYLASPASLPGALEAESFYDGGEGSGYHDVDAANHGGYYRPNEGVDIDRDATGGDQRYYVGWTQPGEWLAYPIHAERGGYYIAGLQLAAVGSGGVLHLEVDGVDVTGPLAVPDTGGWRAWQTLETPAFYLFGGSHTLRLVFDRAGASGSVANVDWINFR